MKTTSYGVEAELVVWLNHDGSETWVIREGGEIILTADKRVALEVWNNL